MNGDIQHFKRLQALLRVVDAIRLAKVRCLTPDQLIAKVHRIWEEQRPSELINHLLTVELSSAQLQTLTAALIKLAEDGDKLPSREKARVDRILLRLVRLLPPEFASIIAESALEHSRKARRELAYWGFRSIGVDRLLAQRILQRFKETGDEKLLELIARNPEVVSITEPEFLLQAISEHYWRTRIMEALLRYDRQRATRLASEYPREFVHAAGRLEDRSFLPKLHALYRSNRNDVEFLSLYGWALGKLRAGKALQALAAVIEREVEKLTSDTAS